MEENKDQRNSEYRQFLRSDHIELDVQVQHKMLLLG